MKSAKFRSTVIVAVSSILVAAFLLGACSPTPAASPTAAPKPASAPTTAPAAPTAAPAAAANPGAPTAAPAKPAAATPKKPEGTLTVALTDLANFLTTPHLAGTTMTKSYNDAIYDHVVNVVPGKKGEFEPGLAKSWKANDTYTVWTFDLRTDVKFHNGDPVTSEDIKFGIEMWIDKESKGWTADMFRTKLDRVETPNPATLIIHAKEPWLDVPLMVSSYSLPLAIPKKYIQEKGWQHFADNPVGSGSWKFVERKTGDYIKLQAVENHWRKTPEFQYLVLKTVPEASTRIAMLKTGQADVVDLDLLSVDEAKKAGIKVARFEDMNAVFLVMFGQMKQDRPQYDAKVPWALADETKAKKVRQALNMAIDRQKIVDTLFQGYGRPAPSTFFFPGDEGFDPNWKAPAYDPQKAKQLLAEAGYPNGFTAKMWLMKRVGVPLPELGQAVDMYWNEIGVKMNIETLDWVTVRGKMPERLSGMVLPYPLGPSGPMTLVSLFGTSYGRYGWIENQKLDDLMKAAEKATSPKARADTFRQIGTIFLEESNLVPVAYTPALYGVSDKVGEWPNNLMSMVPTYFEYMARK